MYHEKVIIVSHKFGRGEKSLVEGPLSNDICIEFSHPVRYAVFTDNGKSKARNQLVNSVVNLGIRMIRSSRKENDFLVLFLGPLNYFIAFGSYFGNIF